MPTANGFGHDEMPADPVGWTVKRRFQEPVSGLSVYMAGSVNKMVAFHLSLHPESAKTVNRTAQHYSAPEPLANQQP
jgi:hypothetical protein